MRRLGTGGETYMLRGVWWSAVLISGLLGAVAGAGLMFGLTQAFGGSSDGHSSSGTRVSASRNGAPARNGVDAAAIYDQVSPSVVTIDTTTVTRRRRDQGEGSGIVLDTKGHILTNYHVVQGANDIQVTLPDNGRQYTATVAAQDEDNDLAVVTISAPAGTLHPVTLGDSAHLHVGEPVLALGNPLGYERSLTEGIVSGLDRTFDDGSGSPLQHLIQEDAAINPGNSGGPLLNGNGEVVGINTLLDNSDNSENFAGLGFAVPISAARDVIGRATGTQKP
jgi:putative serine protease PepD